MTLPKPRVLVADDEHIIADTLALILDQNGFETRIAYSGESALELASSFKPQTLISDVIMGGLNGVDAAIRIRDILPNINVLLVSGQAAAANLLDLARANGFAFDIMAKPVPPEELLGWLRA